MTKRVVNQINFTFELTERIKGTVKGRYSKVNKKDLPKKIKLQIKKTAIRSRIPTIREHNPPLVKLVFHTKMYYTPKTVQEKRAVKFGVELLTKHGYGHTIAVPVMELTKELKERGVKISHPTVMQYWRALERLGYVKREMQARIWGVTYRLNRYAFNNLINTPSNGKKTTN